MDALSSSAHVVHTTITPDAEEEEASASSCRCFFLDFWMLDVCSDKYLHQVSAGERGAPPGTPLGDLCQSSIFLWGGWFMCVGEVSLVKQQLNSSSVCLGIMLQGRQVLFTLYLGHLH